MPKSKKFDTEVQYLKYKVLREVAREVWEGTLFENLLDIPMRIVPGKIPTVRCCVYKERAILAERIKIALGGDKQNPNVIEVIDIACDECPAAGYEVTDSCRGCIAQRCIHACKRNAIMIDEVRHVARIDKSLCVECGQCADVCPFSAIINRKRPCQIACKVNAIAINEDNAASVDDEKCTQCGACVYQCPFGAIMDKSYIVSVVEMLKEALTGGETEVVAVVAPSIATQFVYAKPGQVIKGLKKLGFSQVIEAALGADMVAMAEACELEEEGFLTNSCCPAFVSYVHSAFPELVPYVSTNLSPMATIAKYIKEKNKNAKVVFIGPCIAKKAEAQLDSVKPYVDAVMTFEELQALYYSRDINITELDEESIENASPYGRLFARSGGLSEAVSQALAERGSDFELKPAICDGIEACRVALFKKSKDVLDANFIEGMACTGGCIGGAGCLTHGEKRRGDVDKHSSASKTASITESISKL